VTRRVVRVIARLNVGGPAIHTVLLTEGLAARGWDSTLVTGAVSTQEGDMGYYAAQRGVTPLVVEGLSNRAGPIAVAQAVLELVRLLRRLRPHVVHTHTTKAGLVGRLAAVLYNAVGRARGAPRARIVHTFHGHILTGYFPAPVSRVLRLGERVLALATDRILTVSDGLRRELVEEYRVAPARKVGVVPLGFDFAWVHDLPAEAGALRRRHGIPDDAPAIGMVGRLTAIKNHELLLTALTLMRRAEARLMVVGGGERQEPLERMVSALGLEPRVIFAGWERKPARIYADLDLVCISSRNEGTPVALIEAMAAGRAVVSTRVGGVPDLMIGEGRMQPGGFEVFANGILVPPEVPEALAAALDHLVERPALRRAMGAAGQADVLKRFSCERLLDDVEAMYGRAIDGMGMEV